MKTRFILASLLISFATAGIIELNNDSEVDELFGKFEFVVIDYFDPFDPEVESRGSFFKEAYQMYE